MTDPTGSTREIDGQARQELERAGWEVVEPLATSERFACYKVRAGERLGCAKYATGELQTQIAKDALWSQLIERLVVQQKVGAVVRAPRLLYHTPSCNVFEWTAGTALATEGDRVPTLDAATIKRVATALVTLDRLALAAPGREETWFVPEYRTRKLQNMQDGVAAAWERGWLNEEQMRQLLAVRSGVPDCQAVLQHGDLAPWHIMVEGEAAVIVDGEWSSAGYPRWYDLAYLYGRIAARGRNRPVAAAMLQAVADSAEAGDTVVPQVFAILAERVFHELYAATIDTAEGYSQEALALRDIILGGDPQNLL